jgi:cobalt-zinc-cadmium efflux system protein
VGAGHSHGDSGAHSHGERAPLKTALALTVAIAALELGGGLVAHSLALVADSAHVFMDALALGIAVVAGMQARRPANVRQSYGFARMEILAALLNGGLLFAITVLIVMEALHRFSSPELPQGGIMLGVALVGIVVNVGLGFALARTAGDNMNVRAALLHVASDAVGAIAVALAGILVLTTHIAWVDPLASLAVAAIILFGVLQVVRAAADVLLESAPEHAAIPKVRGALLELDGVAGVHDLHVWTIGAGTIVLSAHVLLPDKKISEASAVLRAIESSLRSDFGITHVTIQFECESCGDDDRIVCTQVPAAASAVPHRH